MLSCDAIIIGGGVNGLACARRLTARGRRVLVLEAAAQPGGGAGEAEFHPGFRTPALAHLTQGLDPRLAGAVPVGFHPPLTTLVMGEGGPLAVRGGEAEGPDAERWAALHARLTRFATALAPFRMMAPPRLGGPGNEWTRLARTLWGVRGLGRDELRELMRMILINVHDVGEDELGDDRLRGLLSFDATLGAWLGPRSPNSLILYLDRLARGPDPLLPRGGMAALAATMAKGLEVRCNARVEAILVQEDRAVGVRLAGGEELRAGAVVSAVNPRTTFHALVDVRELDAGFHTRIGHVRMRGGAAKLHLALDGLPPMRDPMARIVIAPSSQAVEAAFNPVKYGEVPEKPVIECVIPTAHEPGLAPEGQHVLSAIVQFAPHQPRQGLQAARAQLLANSLTVLDAALPGLKARIHHAELLMPQDIEARFGMIGGNWHHGELAVEQMLFNRPLHGTDRYATPIPGLWLAGAGAHPGGGINGAAGWNAAERILAEGRA